MEDGSGVVESVGDEVTLFKVGDRVAPVFPQGHDFVRAARFAPCDMFAYVRKKTWR